MKKRITAALLSLVLVLLCVALQPQKVQAVTLVKAGPCGEGVSFSLWDNGVLEISGNGRMYDYGYSNGTIKVRPWSNSTVEIKYVKIGYGVTNIGSQAFSGLSELVSVTIPASVTSIGSQAFSQCTSLKTVNIPKAVTTIGSLAFYNSGLTDFVTIGANVTQIGDTAFSGCSNLKGILVDSGNTMYCNDSYGVLFDKAKTRLYSAPGQISGSYTIPASVSVIEKKAFLNCGKLTSLTIPDGIEAIGDETFKACSSLRSITIPDSVTQIGECVFEDCTSLKSIVLPNKIESLKVATFRGCSALTDITFNENLMKISGNVFEGCTSLEKIVIPETVAYIGSSAFLGCKNLKTVVLPESITTVGSSTFENCYALKDINLENIEQIYMYAFKNCSSLESVTIPEGVREIDDEAFRGCSALVELHLPSTLYRIDFLAFADCISLKTVTLPQAVSTLGSGAFAGCSSLMSICADENSAYYTTDSTGALYDKAMTSLIAVPAGLSGHFIVPESVTGLASYAFGGCSKITRITLPKTISYLNRYTFLNCTGLMSINLPARFHLDNYVFEGCSNLHVLFAGNEVQAEGIETDFKSVVDAMNAILHCNASGDEVCVMYCNGKWCSYCEICDCFYDATGEKMNPPTGWAKIEDKWTYYQEGVRVQNRWVKDGEL